MTTYPNCKINLGLYVVGKRPDGYHDLETIFLPVHEMHDELEINPLITHHSSPKRASRSTMRPRTTSACAPGGCCTTSSASLPSASA